VAAGVAGGGDLVACACVAALHFHSNRFQTVVPGELQDLLRITAVVVKHQHAGLHIATGAVLLPDLFELFMRHDMLCQPHIARPGSAWVFLWKGERVSMSVGMKLRL
jgi:hypothetical protein